MTCTYSNALCFVNILIKQSNSSLFLIVLPDRVVSDPVRADGFDEGGVCLPGHICTQ